MKVRYLTLALCAMAFSSPPPTLAQNTSIRAHSILDLYPDTVEGLHAFLQSYIDAIKDADRDTLARMDESLRMPGPKIWFVAAFGMKLGRAKAEQYIAAAPGLYPFLDRFDLGPSLEIHISHVEFSTEHDAKASGIPLLTSATHPVAYYSVYLSYDNKPGALVLYPLFVYFDHAFRLINREFGRIEEQNRPSCGLGRLSRHRIAVIEEALQRVSPPEPASALPLPKGSSIGTAQTLKLLLSVACNGQVLETDYLAGPPQLYRLAADAVKRWKYAQKIFNGLPVEIDSTATVVFRPTESREQSPTSRD